jgi:hypothetical protein
MANTNDNASIHSGPLNRCRTALYWCCCAGMVALAIGRAEARDDGRYAQSPLKGWFDGLKSGRGPCCSDADGSTVSDVDWTTKDGHYRVRIDDEWYDVPDDAVITEPNRVGRTMVWPMRGYQGLSIRCFMPGSMT